MESTINDIIQKFPRYIPIFEEIIIMSNTYLNNRVNPDDFYKKYMLLMNDMNLLIKNLDLDSIKSDIQNMLFTPEGSIAYDYASSDFEK